MLCPRCGSSVGEQVRLCDRCAQAEPPKPPAAPEAASQNKKSSPRLPHELPFDTSILMRVMSPLGLGLISLFIWLVSSIFFALELKNGSVGAALLLGGMFVCLTVGLISWAWMWLQMFVDEPLLAFFSLLFPVMVYRVVMTYPERTLRPFLIHAGMGIGGLVLYLVSGALYDENVVLRAAQIVFGASIEQPAPDDYSMDYNSNLE